MSFPRSNRILIGMSGSPTFNPAHFSPQRHRESGVSQRYSVHLSVLCASAVKGVLITQSHCANEIHIAAQTEPVLYWVKFCDSSYKDSVYGTVN